MSCWCRLKIPVRIYFNQFFYHQVLPINPFPTTVRSITEFDTDLPANLDLAHLLTEPSKHTPFSYHQEFMNDASADSPFSYHPKHPQGPSRWKDYYPECGGDLQSPINIRTQECVAHKFRNPLMYPMSDKSPTKVTIENNGYSGGFLMIFRTSWITVRTVQNSLSLRL